MNPGKTPNPDEPQPRPDEEPIAIEEPLEDGDPNGQPN